MVRSTSPVAGDQGGPGWWTAAAAGADPRVAGHLGRVRGQEPGHAVRDDYEEGADAGAAGGAASRRLRVRRHRPGDDGTAAGQQEGGSATVARRGVMTRH